MMNHISKYEFKAELRKSREVLERKKDALGTLGEAKEVIVYSFGDRGSDLARQLRARGVTSFVFDNSAVARQRAKAEGFYVVDNLEKDVPVIVGAGQNQCSILNTLDRPAWGLAEGLYAFDLFHPYDKSRKFADIIPVLADDLYEIYNRIDDAYSKDFLYLLRYRASLDPFHLEAIRQPIQDIYIPPKAVGPITSLCDAGAYNGDTITHLKGHFPMLKSVLAIEPNSDLIPQIESAAERVHVTCRIFEGIAWDCREQLGAQVLPNGMMSVIAESKGAIPADTLDNIAGDMVCEYAKFDVEGAEIQAIKGGKSMLSRAKCLAISAYHLPTDLVDIPAAVDHISGGSAKTWRWGFRHYSDVIDDSVFYVYRA